ncbi:MAG: enoyl-CoA hydratase [Marinomonas primoryensis]|jgi:enoyl-CoA hydratase
MFSCIDYNVVERVAYITLNRPEKRNALSMRMQEELSEALWESDNNTEVHCAVIAGAGSSFCSGYDLGEYGSASAPSYAPAAENSRRHRSIDDDAWHLEQAQRLRMAIFEMHKPVIAQVHGYCLAGGTDLALLCDMVIASTDAVFGFPPARDLGSLPNQMWLYHVGPQWAKRLLLTGDTITGAEAQQIGLVLKAVEPKLLQDEVRQLAQRLSNIDPDLLSANKRIVNLGLELMGAKTLQRLAAELDARAHTSEAAKTFRRSIKEKGLKQTLLDRDSQFGDGRARVMGPECRDDKGHLLDD